ncbi:MAG: OmpA family protein [Granulosicoccus sp.]|nr:OmpA family protein [Granulosicoccus sp.]
MSTQLHYSFSRRFFKGRHSALAAFSRRRAVPASISKPRVVGLAVLAALGTAFADDSPLKQDFKRRAYIGLGIGGTDLDPESLTSSLTVGEDRDAGGALFLGYDISPRFTLEGYYSNLGEAGIDFLGESVGALQYEVYGLSVLGYLGNSRDANDYSGVCATCDNIGLYRREGLSPYVRLGVGGMSNDSELEYERDHDVHLTVGAGVEYGWSSGFALRAEVISYDTDAHYAGLGVLKRFGKASGDDQSVNRLKEKVQMDARPLDFPVPTFPFAQHGVTPEAETLLLELADQMKTDPALKIKLSGHTDSIGSDNFNQVLSLKRAASVKEFLLGQGIETERMVLEGMGEAKPVATNETEEGRSMNRRVQISSM